MSFGPDTVLLEAIISASTYEALQKRSHDQSRPIGEIIDALLQQGQRSTRRQEASKASFNPQKHLREAAIDLGRTALLFIDVQNFSCHSDGTCHAGNPNGPHLDYWWKRMESVQPQWQLLQQICRQAGIEVMYTVMESLTADGRDRSLDYKISGYHIPPNSFDAQVSECIQPGDDEIVVPKTSSSVFMTTNIDTILRNLDIRNLILAGVLTDQCVESAVRDACDLNYLVTLVTDCCATYSADRHENACKAIQGYCRQRSVKEVKDEIEHLLSEREAQMTK